MTTRWTPTTERAGLRATSVATIALLALLCCNPSCKREPAPFAAQADSAARPASPSESAPSEEDALPALDARRSAGLRENDLPESAPDDAPLPAPDEIPDFLAPPGHRAAGGEPIGQVPDAALDLTVQLRDEGASLVGQPREPAADDSLDSLMRHVRLEEEGADDEGSFASVTTTDSPRGGGSEAPALPSLPAEAAPAWNAGRDGQDHPRAPDVDHPLEDLEDEPAPDWDVDLAIDDAPAPPPDACAHLQDEIDSRMAFLRRVSAERDSYAWVESDEDATALRLLAAMRRCADHPEDEDCRPPPMEVELRDVEPPRHQYESWPTDLEAEHKDPDEVPNDPKIRELLHQLESCRRRQTPQPLLDRGGGR